MSTGNELTIKQRPAYAGSDAFSTYESEHDCPQKQTQRDLVFEHLAPHLPGRKQRLLSLPGMSWSFEKRFLAAFPSPDTRVVGIEWNVRTFERSVPYMPRVGNWERALFDPITLSNRACITRWTTRQAHWLFIHASSFLNLGRSLKDSKLQRKKWARRFKSFTAVWLDFPSPLCEETLSAMENLASCLHRYANNAPIAITLLRGRESESLTDQAREEVVTQALSRNRWGRFFTMDQVETYISDTGSPMVTYLGRSRYEP